MTKTTEFAGSSESQSKDSSPQEVAVQDKVRTIGDNCFSRRHGVSDGVLDVLQKTFRGWKFQFGPGMEHAHPIGATERAICEELACREIKRMYGDKVNITDIGGNANRHLSAGRSNIHSCNPLLSSSDAVRRRPENYLKGANYCDNTAQNCQFRPDVYLSVHSLYYLSQNDILKLIHNSSKGVMYAVLHRFDNVYGGLHFDGKNYESKYSMFVEDNKVKVHMTVKGNCVGYTHDPCLWINSNYYQSEDKAIAWDGQPIGDSWLYRFVIAKPNLSPDRAKEMSLVNSLDRNDHYGSVDGVLSFGDQATLKPVLGFLKLKKAEFVSFGSFTAMYSSSSVVTLIPKDLVKQVALDMVGRPRDSTTLRLCIDKMKSYLKKMDMPVDIKITCATYGSALAFLYSIKDEILAFNNLCLPVHKRLYVKLRNALTLEDFVCCSKATLAQIDAELDSSQETVTSYNSDRTSVPTTSFDAHAAWPKGLPGYESNMELKTMKESAWIKPHDDDSDDKVYGPQFHANCVTFSNLIPLVPNPSKNNEEKALINRALVATLPENADAWARVHAHAQRLVKDVEPVEGNYDCLFMEWNTKFPKPKQQQYLDAYCQIKADGLKNTDYLTEMFVKRELTLKGGPVVDEFDPRAIQGCSDKVNVAYGPFIWRASKQLNNLWNSGERIFYASGHTAEELGEWRLQFDSDSDVTIVELDESRYDAHQGVGCHELGGVFKRATGIESYKYANDVEKHIYRTKGRSKFFKFGVDGTMSSGRQDTSCSNTFVNGSKLDCFLQDYGFNKSDYKMVVNGDDSLVVIRKSMCASMRDTLCKYLTGRNHELGFSSKCKVRTEWYDVEFCSSLFWPVSGGYVLGPKIGRRLPKIGFNLNELDPLDIEGMLIGLAIDASYIPVLFEYITVCQKLVNKNKKSKNRRYIDKEAIYKIRATSPHTATQDTDVFFEQRYGIDARFAREVMCQTMATARVLTSCVDFPLMEVFTLVDV